MCRPAQSKPDSTEHTCNRVPKSAPRPALTQMGALLLMFPKHFTKRALIHPPRREMQQCALGIFHFVSGYQSKGLNQKARFILLKQVMLKSQKSKSSNWLVSSLNGNGKFSVFLGRWKFWFSLDQPHVNRTD